MVEPPCPGNQDYFRDDSGPRHLAGARRRAAKAIPEVRHQQSSDVSPEGVAADAVAGPSGSYIQPDTGGEQEQFHRQRSRNRVPQSEAAASAAGVERQVRAMGNPVQYPVA